MLRTMTRPGALEMERVMAKAFLRTAIEGRRWIVLAWFAANRAHLFEPSYLSLQLFGTVRAVNSHHY